MLRYLYHWFHICMAGKSNHIQKKMPEFFGNTIMVNGKVWPNLDVAQGWYRFRNRAESKCIPL